MTIHDELAAIRERCKGHTEGNVMVQHGFCTVFEVYRAPMGTNAIGKAFTSKDGEGCACGPAEADANAELFAASSKILRIATELSATVQRMETALQQLRIERHAYCEDCWYSCPKHEDYCGPSNDECTCGKDQNNAIIDAALTTNGGTDE